MIISHRLKFVFLRCPKTGTTTSQFMLRMCGAFDDKDILTPCVGSFESVNLPDSLSFNHLTPQELIDQKMMTIEQLREYNCFSYFRDPYKRHFSALIHVVGRHAHPKSIHKMLDGTLDGHELHPKAASKLGLITKPQVDYLFVEGEQVVEALDFDNYESECRRMIACVGGLDFPVIPKMNLRGAWKADFKYDEFWTDEYRARFAVEYAEDIEFYGGMRK